MQTALKTLETLKADHPLVADAKKKEAELKARKDAMDSLVAAMEDATEDTGPLDKAIANAKAAGVHDVTIQKATEYRANLQ